MSDSYKHITIVLVFFDQFAMDTQFPNDSLIAYGLLPQLGISYD